MANRSYEERQTRSLACSTAGTYLVTIPKEYIKALKWKAKQKVVVELDGNSIVIKDWKKK